MKKTALVLALMVSLLLSACGDTAKPSESNVPTPAPSNPTDEPQVPADATPEAYTERLDLYAQALSEQWNGAELTDKGLNYMAKDCYGDAPLENIGYLIADLDGDGNQELAIGVTGAVSDIFYGKLILALYTADQDGIVKQVFSSMERDRYYYAGDNKFASLGSSGAADSFETTVKLEGGELTDTTQATDPASYVQMDLAPMSQWDGATSGGQ